MQQLHTGQLTLARDGAQNAAGLGDGSTGKVKKNLAYKLSDLSLVPATHARSGVQN